jgi:hypothetical protein
MLAGILGIISLILFTSSYRSTKNGGVDRRCRRKWGLTLLSLALFIIALVIA